MVHGASELNICCQRQLLSVSVMRKGISTPWLCHPAPVSHMEYKHILPNDPVWYGDWSLCSDTYLTFLLSFIPTMFYTRHKGQGIGGNWRAVDTKSRQDMTSRLMRSLVSEVNIFAMIVPLFHNFSVIITLELFPIFSPFLLMWEEILTEMISCSSSCSCKEMTLSAMLTNKKSEISLKRQKYTLNIPYHW